MTRYSVALGLILGLASGTLFTVVRAKGQNTAPGTPVHMVVSVESYIGGEGAKEGVKLEQQVLITETGPEIMSRAPFEDAFSIE